MNQGLILVDSNKDLSSNYDSPAIFMYNYYALNIQAIWTGSITGAFTLQTSLDYQPGGPAGGPAPFAGTWVTYANSSQDPSGVQSCVWDIFATGARWFRVDFASTGGTGTLTKLLAQLKG